MNQMCLHDQEPQLLPSVISNKPTKDDIEHCFGQFWASGMRKMNKKKASALFAKVLKANTGKQGPTIYDFTTMLCRDVKDRLELDQPGFTAMHPTTYLNGERWEDEKAVVASLSQVQQKAPLMERLKDTSWADHLIG